MRPLTRVGESSLILVEDLYHRRNEIKEWFVLMRKQRIVFRDIALRHFMIKHDRLVVIDYGFAVVLPPEPSVTTTSVQGKAYTKSSHSTHVAL